MGMSMFALGIIALVLSTALLVWVSGQSQNPAAKTGKAIAWICVILSIVFLVVKIGICSKMCMSGACPMMDKMHGDRHMGHEMPMEKGMPPPLPPNGQPK